MFIVIIKHIIHKTCSKFTSTRKPNSIPPNALLFSTAVSEVERSRPLCPSFRPKCINTTLHFVLSSISGVSISKQGAYGYTSVSLFNFTG